MGDFGSLIPCRSMWANTRKYEIMFESIVWGNMRILNRDLVVNRCSPFGIIELEVFQILKFSKF